MIFRFKAEAYMEANSIEEVLENLSKHFANPKGYDPFMAPSSLEIEKLEKIKTTMIEINTGEKKHGKDKRVN